MFWAAAQGAIARAATCIHATSNVEYEEIRALGIASPVAIIPNGVDLPQGAHLQINRTSRVEPSNRTLLFFGRISPIKGLETLLSAWSDVASQFPNWSLRIVGPGEPTYTAELRRQVAAGEMPRVTFEDPIYGDAKWEIYRSADIFVLPSRSENFGLAVAESLASSRPVIVTKGAPWSGVADQGCGWWIDPGEPALTAALRVALATPDDQLLAMGHRGETWVRNAFSWDRIGSQMAEVYAWILGRAERPPFVRPN